MERTPFAIDDAKDEDEEDLTSDEEFESEDDGVLDEVDAFLEAHDSGLTEDQKEIAKGSLPSSTLRVVLDCRILILPPRCVFRSHDGRTSQITLTWHQ